MLEEVGLRGRLKNSDKDEKAGPSAYLLPAPANDKQRIAAFDDLRSVAQGSAAVGCAGGITQSFWSLVSSLLGHHPLRSPGATSSRAIPTLLRSRRSPSRRMQRDRTVLDCGRSEDILAPARIFVATCPHPRSTART